MSGLGAACADEMDGSQVQRVPRTGSIASRRVPCDDSVRVCDWHVFGTCAVDLGMAYDDGLYCIFQQAVRCSMACDDVQGRCFQGSCQSQNAECRSVRHIPGSI